MKLLRGWVGPLALLVATTAFAEAPALGSGPARLVPALRLAHLGLGPQASGRGDLDDPGQARSNTFLTGLGLVGAGLTLGGAGFVLLGACGEGTGCHNTTTTVLGWALAAPGLVPLVVGLFLLWASSDSTSSSGHRASPVSRWGRVLRVEPRLDGRWALTGWLAGEPG